MTRVVQKLDDPLRLRPQADYREADIYHRPAPISGVSKPAKTNGWLQLGDALKDVSPTLNAAISSM